MLIYSLTYKDIIDIVATIIYNIADNITRFGNISNEFKSDYSWTHTIPTSSSASNAKVARQYGRGGPYITSGNDDPLDTGTITFKINSKSNYIIQKNITADSISSNIQSYIIANYSNIFSNVSSFNQIVKTNGLINITNMILNFSIRNMRYVVSPISDNHYIEYIGSNNSKDENITIIEKDDIIRAISTLQLKNFIQNYIKNSIKYKIVEYTYTISR